MTRFVESIRVAVLCGHEGPGFHTGSRRRCRRASTATIVSTVERGDLVLVPIGWATQVRDGQIEVLCPDHKEKEKA